METHRINVLLVADDPGIARLVGETLHAEAPDRFRLSCVNTLSAALERVGRRVVDALLLDVSQQGGQGLEMVAMLLRQAPDVPILVITALKDEAHARQAYEMVAQDCLLKEELTGRTLVRSLSYALGRHRLQLKVNERTQALRDCESRLREIERELWHLASHDLLTHLPNRALLTDHLHQAIRLARYDPEYRFAVLFLDFDRFKVINDSMGHQIGDMLLVRFAERLRANLRVGDTLRPGVNGRLAARLGGDEFVVLLGGISDVSDAVRVAERLQRDLSVPHLIAGHEVVSTASIGIVSSDAGYQRPEHVIRDADTAMYRAKAAGRARHVLFDEHMHNEVLMKLKLDEDLRRAADQQEFALLYQPIVDLESGGLVGFEALIRWMHPHRGVVSPAEFIPIAEEIGLIVSIGRWVIREACLQLKSWQNRFPMEPPLTVNVNLSKRELSEANLTETVQCVLEEAEIDPASLKLEITESTIMDDTESLIPVLDRLTGLGVQLCMDDFGTGHSSMSCLHRFPIDVLKIDRAFIQDMDAKLDYAAVIHAIITLAHNLNMSVVAEGVDAGDGQLAQLQALQCDHAQGYFFSEPLTAEDADAFILGRARRAVL
ncbi:MAG: putative bifunctional diguanylate cyclase/phosphodiesterase [Planctomycetota bacterium]